MMTDMQQISKAARARSGPTPEFVELCKTLYGDAIDPTIVWTDVIKLSPDQADLAAQRRRSRVTRAAEGVALASTVAGGALGVKEGARTLKLIRSSGGLRKAPGEAKRGLALAGLATGGDAVTTGVLATQGKKKPVEKGAGRLVPTGHTAGDIEKFGLPKLSQFPKVEAQVKGLRRLWNPKPAAPKPGIGPWQGPLTRGQTTAQTAGKDLHAAMSTTTGKVVAGGAAALGTIGAARRLASPGYDQTYAKADDVEFRGEFTKFDDDKRQAFGWASVVKVNGQPVVDRQGDYIDLADLEEAAYAYVHKSRVGGDMHKRAGESAHKVSDMIESMVFTPEKIAKMGLPEDFPQGWWVGYKIHDDDTWSEVRKGGRTGFSIHGKGLRKDHTLDELMGY